MFKGLTKKLSENGNEVFTMTLQERRYNLPITYKWKKTL